MNHEYFDTIHRHELSENTSMTLHELVVKFRKANYAEVEKRATEFAASIPEDDFFRLVLDYANCLNFEWPQYIKRLSLEEYHVIELLCQKYGEKTCAFLDFILFEYDYDEQDLRHLHSGAIHLLLILALRDVRKQVTLERIQKDKDKIYYIYTRTNSLYESLLK